jgi:L-threonylcarbamoyladenylate synthase
MTRTDTLGGMEVFDASGSMLERALSAAREALAKGDLVVLPTDTVYGVGARGDVPGATARLFDAKRRPRGLTLPVLAVDAGQAWAVAVPDDRARRLASRFWPGPLTMVQPRTEVARDWDLGDAGDTVGVRVPAHDVAQALLRVTGPLPVTSANRSGQPTPADCEGVRAALGESVAVYLCAGPSDGTASTVLDLGGPSPRLLREGVIPGKVLLAAL